MVVQRGSLFGIREEMNNVGFIHVVLQCRMGTPSMLIVFVTFGRSHIRVIMGVFLRFLVVLFLSASRVGVSVLRVGCK